METHCHHRTLNSNSTEGSLHCRILFCQIFPVAPMRTTLICCPGDAKRGRAEDTQTSLEGHHSAKSEVTACDTDFGEVLSGPPHTLDLRQG